MNKVKEIFSNTKINIFLGIIGCVLFLIIGRSFYFSIENYLFILGLLWYFITLLNRIYRKKGDIKIANYLLISCYVLQILVTFIGYRYGYGYICNLTILCFGFVIPALYFFNVLLRKKLVINNKIFAISILLCLIPAYFSGGYLMAIEFLVYLLIIPYFYNYYELLKEEISNG